MDKNTIAVIQQTPDVGGAETYMYSLMKEWNKIANVTLSTNNQKFKNLAKESNIEVYDIPVILDIIGNWKGLVKAIVYLPYAIVFYWSLLSKLKRAKTDCIVMSGFSEKMLVTFLSTFFHIPVVWIEYAPLDTIFTRNFSLPKFLYLSLYKQAKIVIVPTTYTKNALVKSGINTSSLKIIPCGIEMPEKQYEKIKEFKNSFVVGNVSRLTREKGQQYLILAAKKIKEAIPSAIILLIGQGPDKKYFEELMRKEGVSSFVKILGFVENLDEYYDSMDIFVFPTVWDLEGFGLVSIEAMSHKLPVIAADNGPVSSIVKDKRTGILIPKENARAIADTVIKLYSNKTLREKLTKTGFSDVLHNYTIQTVAQRIYEELT